MNGIFSKEVMGATVSVECYFSADPYLGASSSNDFGFSV